MCWSTDIQRREGTHRHRKSHVKIVENWIHDPNMVEDQTQLVPDHEVMDGYH